MGNSLILTISDLQIPFEHVDALDFVLHVKKTFWKAGDDLSVINMGDEVDQHTLSKWGANPNGMSGGEEVEESKLRLKDWYSYFPHTKVCISNHTYRVFKRASDAGIPTQFLRSIAEAYEAPDGWQWAYRWLEQGICFEHGENVSGINAALRAALDNRLPTVIGHQHTFAGVQYSASIANVIWGMNTGCLIDEDLYAFEYGIKLRKKPTLGTGIILNGMPFFIPMILDRKKRWVKRI